MSVPFFKNTKDNTHCFQACLKMILKNYFPFEQYSFKKLDKITGKQAGKWTWPMKGIIFLQSKGLLLKHINNFNYEAFGRNSYSYLRRVWRDKEFYDAQVSNSNIPYESSVAKLYATKGIHRKKRPEQHDLFKLLRDGCILMCNVNYYALHCKTGYSGHFVVVYKIVNDKVYLHDPGLPGQRDMIVSLTTFMKAWRGRDLIAVRNA